MIGHLHPWDNDKQPEQSINGKKISGDMIKFYKREPTWKWDYIDYKPLLKNPYNQFIYEKSNGSKVPFLLNGPHPAIIVTRHGFVTYGTGKNSAIITADAASGGVLDEKTVQLVEWNRNYFHPF